MLQKGNRNLDPWDQYIETRVHWCEKMLHQTLVQHYVHENHV